VTGRDRTDNRRNALPITGPTTPVSKVYGGLAGDAVHDGEATLS
jgi:hypothetical protein